MSDKNELEQLRAENRVLREVLQKMRCVSSENNWVKREVEQALAASRIPETAREVRRVRALEKVAKSTKCWISKMRRIIEISHALAELDLIEKEK